ncbi:MAG: hypothetical protein HRT74_02590, partial [Flavobacteriales bacterium]|nr:hypothetical protein [Flavobacteriales bacterium]
MAEPSSLIKLPSKEQVLERNQTITSNYARIYESCPELFKWAAMASFASFHIGEKMKLWNWEASGIRTFDDTCLRKNRTIEDDFQVIRVLNNAIYERVGTLHSDFLKLPYRTFQGMLLQKEGHQIISKSFDQLHTARLFLEQFQYLDNEHKSIVWEANVNILWHEQYRVVQPHFDQLTGLFSNTMSLIASFDYRVNHRKTGRFLPSRFVLFMLFKGW